MENIPVLRKIALKLETSGTAIPISNTKLYRDGFGFVGLSVYVPVTPNRAAGSKPLCTVHRTIIDTAGNRKQFNHDKYNLVFVDNVTLDGVRYMLFENPMPKAFTDTEGDLELVFNYSEIGINAHGEQVVCSRLATNIYRTTVAEGGSSESETVTDFKGQETAQINANTIAIESLVDDVENLLKPPDVSEANQVGSPAVTITEDGNFKFTNLKGKTGAMGLTPDIVVNVVGLPAGSPPTVERSGTVDNPVLNFHLPKGDKGDTGEPFAVKKVYDSVATMLANFAVDLKDGEFAMIETDDIENEDCAKLYVRNDAGMSFVTDLSGARGFKGETGKTGDTGAAGPQGAGIVSIIKIGANGLADTYKILLSDNSESYFVVTNGAQGIKGNDAYIQKETVTDSGDITKALTSHVFCNFTSAAITSLTLSLSEGESGRLNEYAFQFMTTAAIPTLTLPATIKWTNGFNPITDLETHTLYQFSISENMGVVVGVFYE